MQRHKHVVANAVCGAVLAASASSQGGIPPQPHPVYTIAAAATTMDSIADLDGDGFRDLVLGIPGATPPRVQVHSGRNGALLGTYTGPTGIDFATIVRSTGDVNGDGLEEILVGAPGAPNGGRCYLLSVPSGGGVTLLQSWVRNASTPGTGDLYSWAVTRLDDLTGDGVEEVAVSDSSFTVQGTASGHQGLVEILDVTTFPPTLLLALTGPNEWDQYGDSLCALDDLDGDGFRELAIGATQAFGPGGTFPGTAPGYADVYSGASLAALPILLSHSVGLSGFSVFGFDVASAGDVTNTGYDALIVGAPDPLNNPGAIAPTIPGAWIAGAGGGDPGFLNVNQNPGSSSCRDYAASISGLHTPGANGDFDSDGHADVLIGAPERFSISCGIPGKAYLRSGRTGQVIYSLNAPGMTFSFGWAVTELYTFNGGEHFAIADPAAGKVFVY